MTKRNLGKVFVTGADGFIGSHLTERLVREGFEVTALCLYNSNGSYGWLEHLAVDCPKNLKLILGDVRDPFFVQSATKGHDTVFHLAALIAIPYSYVAPQNYVETNITGTLNILEAVRINRIGRLVHTSTSEVYGTAQIVPISETHPLQGQSPYSASKIGADMMVDSYCRSFSVPATILRPFNTYGPRQSLRAVIPTVLTQLIAGNKTIRLGSISPTRDFNFVEDTVAAFIALGSCDSEKVYGNVFNAGSGREITIENMVLAVAKILGKDVVIETEEARLRPALSEVERLCADSTRLKQLTGWAPATTLETGLQKFADWLKLNPVRKDVTKYHV